MHRTRPGTAIEMDCIFMHVMLRILFYSGEKNVASIQQNDERANWSEHYHKTCALTEHILAAFILRPVQYGIFPTGEFQSKKKLKMGDHGGRHREQ